MARPWSCRHMRHLLVVSSARCRSTSTVADCGTIAEVLKCNPCWRTLSKIPQLQTREYRKESVFAGNDALRRPKMRGIVKAADASTTATAAAAAETMVAAA